MISRAYELTVTIEAQAESIIWKQSCNSKIASFCKSSTNEVEL